MSVDGTATRRTFLKYSLTAPAALAAGHAQGANDRINVGMIGLGGRGGYLFNMVLHRIAEKSDVELVALCDPYQLRLSEAASKVPGAKTYVYHQELLEHPGLNAVIIATPDHWHAPITLAALDRLLRKAHDAHSGRGAHGARPGAGKEPHHAGGSAGAFMGPVA